MERIYSYTILITSCHSILLFQLDQIPYKSHYLILWSNINSIIHSDSNSILLKFEGPTRKVNDEGFLQTNVHLSITCLCGSLLCRVESCLTYSIFTVTNLMHPEFKNSAGLNPAKCKVEETVFQMVYIFY